MFEQLKQTANQLGRMRKEHLINQSGSTADDSLDKVRSGQSYLYMSQGMDSEVFEVRFKERVSGSDLTEAIRYALMRFPYINTRLIELDGDFYIVQNPVAMVAHPTKNLGKLGSLRTNEHLVEVTYHKNSAYFAFHHALCNGRGVKPFIETVIYYYCQRFYHSNAQAEGIRLKDTPLLPNETADAFWDFYDYDDSKDFPTFSRDAYEIPESKPNDDINDYRFEITIPQSDYMAVAKANNATPVILLSYAISQTIAKLFPDFDKPINANIATDMRAALGYKNTFKNTVKSMILPYTKDDTSKTFKEIATNYRTYLNQQKDIDFCKKEANGIIGLYNKLDEAPSFEEKQKLLAFMENIHLNTYTISYIGQFILNENEQYIDSIHLYSAGTIGLSINMICASGKFTIDVKQNFPEDTYVKPFLETLAELGITNAQVSDSIPFTTPKDGLRNRK